MENSIRDRLLSLLDKANVLRDPDPMAVEARVQELAGLFDLKDEPEVQGLSSSMRQFAIMSLSLDQIPDDEAVLFVTTNPDLLRLSNRLTERYGLRPIHIADVAREEEDQA